MSAENMFHPDPVVFLGIERVLDQMPFSPAALDHPGHPLGRKIREVGDVSVKTGCLGGDFAQENDLGLILAQHDVLDPAKVLQPRLAARSEPNAQVVGPVQGQQLEGLVPSRGLTAFLEGQDVFPAELLAARYQRLAAIQAIADQAKRQFGELGFEPLAQALPAPE